MKAATRLEHSLIDNLVSTLRQWSAIFCLLLPSADTQRSSLDINNLLTWTIINDIIVPDEYQAFWQDPQGVGLGFKLKQTSSALKNVAHALR
jgi:hypothetical protein